MAQIPYVTLNNSVKMPQLGLGVWRVIDGGETIKSVHAAIDAGYRLIDTASMYDNERGVGEGIRTSGVPREEIFVTSKVWNGDQGYEKTMRAFDASLERLGFDYLDLYLIHWPVPEDDKYIDTWRAMEEIYESGRVKAIGVSNFNIEHLEKLLAHCKVTPAINQVECHPHLPQDELRKYCDEKNIQVEAWRPLGGPHGDLLKHHTILEIAEKHSRSAAQILLRWGVQQNMIVIPKSIHPDRIRANAEVFDFELDKEDMARIDGLNTGFRFGPNPTTMNSH